MAKPPAKCTPLEIESIRLAMCLQDLVQRLHETDHVKVHGPHAEFTTGWGRPADGYAPNRHDALTGSQADGRAFPAGEDRTCRNWTSSTQGSAMLGHIDRKGLRDDAASRSWNASHPSRGPDGGCSQADLRSTGGDGLFYCFAAN
jgi:hypothetical protein